MEGFFLRTDASMMRLVLDPEFRNMPINYLVQREDQPDFPHLLIGYFEPFQSPVAWLDGLIEMVNAQISENMDEGRAICQTSKHRTEIAPKIQRDIWREFLTSLDDFAENLPDQVGSLIFVLDPPDIVETDVWLKRMRFLADHTRSPWLKFLVLDKRGDPALAALEDHPRVETLLFWMSPDEIERRADNVLKNSGGLKGYF